MTKSILGDRWTYLQDGRPRAGRSRHLIDWYEFGGRVRAALDAESTLGPRITTTPDDVAYRRFA